MEIDDAGIATGRWIWSNVPAAATVVAYTAGTTQLWQRPIRGIVQFAYSVQATVGHDLPGTAVAYDGTGNEIARTPHEPGDALSGPTTDTTLPDLTQEQGESLSRLTDSTMRTCLGRFGATTVSANVMALPDPADGLRAWAPCVTETQQLVAAALDAMNPRFYDAGKGELPTALNPYRGAPLPSDPSLPLKQPTHSPASSGP